MAKFDYTTKAIVGVAVQNGLTPNAQVIVCGYLDGGILHRLTREAAIDMFPPRGDVFAHNMIGINEEVKNELIRIQVKPNTNLSDARNSDFIWDKSGDWQYYGDKVIKEPNQSITSDGASNFDFVMKRGYLNEKKDIFFTCGSYLYCYNADEDPYELIRWNLNESSKQMKNALFSVGDNLYIVDDFDDEYESVDCMSNTQLYKWFFKNVLKDIGEDIRCEEFKAKHANSIAKSLANLDLPSSVYESRLKRLRNLCEDVVLSEEMFSDIATSSWLTSSIEKALENYSISAVEKKQALVQSELHKIELQLAEEVEMAKQESAKVVERINADTERKIAEAHSKIDVLVSEREDINLSIEDKKRELADLSTRCVEKERNLSELDGRASKIADDFRIIKEVLNIGDANQGNHEEKPNAFPSASVRLIHKNFSDVPAMQVKTLVGNLKYNLKVNNRSKVDERNLAALLLNSKVLMLPDTKIAKSIIDAIGNCIYIPKYVDVKWTGFEDLWKEGLGSLVESAINEPDTMHFMVLQNTNLTYLPSILQPIIDIIIGLIDEFPNVPCAYPENLRILCVAQGDGGIAPAEQCLKYMGCLAKDNYAENEEDDLSPISTTMTKPSEYIPAALVRHTPGLVPQSDYKSYIDSDE